MANLRRVTDELNGIKTYLRITFPENECKRMMENNGFTLVVKKNIPSVNKKRKTHENVLVASSICQTFRGKMEKKITYRRSQKAHQQRQQPIKMLFFNIFIFIFPV